LKEQSSSPKRKREFLVRRCKPSIETRHRIKNIHQLRNLLQEAVELEHFTIPPYLCALYSIQEGTNQEAVQIIRSVVMEEMLHMVLAANVLNAIGGKPSITHRKFVPKYPAKLPVIDETFIVHLSRFSQEAIETFVKIERPSSPKGDPHGCDCIEQFHTIGQFYEAIELGLMELSHGNNIFTGNPSRQIGPEHYYGGGGKVIPVTDLDSALQALTEIIGQGEGVHHTIWDGDDEFGAEVTEVAHYFRFKEILAGRRYQAGDKFASDPSGEPFRVCWDEVCLMQKNPKIGNYPEGSELRKKATAFNRAYMSLLKELHAATNGKPGRLMTSVPIMYQLKYQAIELMKIPADDGDETAGPSFEFLAP
jgi:hypothetical protein